MEPLDRATGSSLLSGPLFYKTKYWHKEVRKIQGVQQ
jgi:hypothetical protein